ncbi:MAG: FmdB family zinc ribbon protein [Nitrospiraceae bacterium]
MPLYEYRCEGCGEQFEMSQSINVRVEDTVCPHCQARKATRLMSAFASKIVGDHKPGFSEMKAYSQLNERMDKFKKLPPAFGKRVTPSPDLFNGGGGPPSKSDGGPGKS